MFRGIRRQLLISVWILAVLVGTATICSGKYSGGTGEPNTPYKIANVADLMTLAADTNDYNKCFLMTADINLAPNLPGNKVFSTAVIAPDTDNINNGIFDGVPFTGVFDGGRHRILNLTIDANTTGNDFLGLFGDVNLGEVKNLNLMNFTITGGDTSYYIGGLAGRNGSDINNCQSTGIITGGLYCIGGLLGSNSDGSIIRCITVGYVTGDNCSQCLGGMVGYNLSGDINNCWSRVTVAAGENTWLLGGLVGYNYSGPISNCYSTNTINGGDNSRRFGGLVGSNGGDINNCYSTGDVNGLGELGGLVGSNGGNISNCYSTGAITGRISSDSVGGLLGYNGGAISDCYSAGTVTAGDNSQSMGGLVGENDGDINNCHATGAITGGDYSYSVGGLAGENIGSIGNSYSAGAVTDLNESYYIGGLVGRNIGSISRCSSTGAVAGAYGTGGLVGYNISNNSINACFSTGNVTGRNELGGLVGHNHNGPISNCFSAGDINGVDILGGLVGNNEDNISNCYSTGIVTGSSANLGGLIGFGVGGVISRSYFLSTSGPNNGYGMPLTDTQMKQQASFVGWDFSTPVWNIHNGECYPYLAWKEYGGGIGTHEKPYQIWTVAELLAMAADTGDYDKHFILMNDLNLDPGLPGGRVFVNAVIGGADFIGVFDGNGHKITNMTINTGGAMTGYLGLFRRIGAGEIKNLGLENTSVTGGYPPECIGALVGENGGGSVNNCYSTGVVSGGEYAKNFGGLIGYNAGNIINCHSTCLVTGGDGSYGFGGLVGENDGTISYCYATGNVTGGGGISGGLGGLVGYNKGFIDNSYSVGTVNGTDTCPLGGLVGMNDGTISDCHSTGIVTGTGSYWFGGLVGSNNGTISHCYSTGNINHSSDAYSTYLGGLAGTNSGTLSHCYATGNITGGNGSTYVGGLVGFMGWDAGSISTCYSTSNVVCGTSSSWIGGLVGGGGGDISNCYSRGNLTCGASSYRLGGLIGSSAGTVRNCYSTGTLNISGSMCGGLAGYGVVVNGSYFLVGSGPNNGLGTPLTDAQMKTLSTFTSAGWDFTNETANGTSDYWRMCVDGVDYPRLNWQSLDGDLACPDGVNFIDFAYFANRWLESDCALSNNFCGGADMASSGTVDMQDLEIFVANWLSGE